MITQALMQMPADSKDEGVNERHDEGADVEPLPEGADTALSHHDLRQLVRKTGQDNSDVSKQIQDALKHGQKL